MVDEPDDILEVFLEIWEKLYPYAVEEFRLKNPNSLEELQADYEEAVEKLQEMNEETAGAFTIMQIHTILPDNAWVQWQFRKLLELARQSIM